MLRSFRSPRILVTGITSIHGWPVWRALCARFSPEQLKGIRPPKMRVPKAPNIRSICITDIDEIRGFTRGFNPTHVVHCDGVCYLDVCEERPEWARSLNAGGADSIRALFGSTAHVYFLSTDLVFSGNNPPECGYAEEYTPDPVSIAGKTFTEAEQVISGCDRSTTIRLGLPVGDSVTGNKGGRDWIESRFRRGLPVTLFHDELRSCVSCEEIADMMLCMMESGREGLFHFGGDQAMSLFELGRSILTQGLYAPHLLKGILRHEEIGGPPRIGNVSLDSRRIRRVLNRYS